MPWFYVDDMFADSKPVMQLDARLRNEAVGLWVRCGAWSAKEETDGRVPLDIVRGFGGSPRVIRALHGQAELWDARAVFDQNLTKIRPESGPKSDQNPREILFKNWDKWQKTKAENEAKRKADAERQANHRRAKKGRNYIPANDESSANVELSQRDTGDEWARVGEDVSQRDGENVSRCESQRPDPDPTQTRPLLVDLSGGVTSVDARVDPRPQCHEHSENYDGPCRKCKRRREWDEANVGVAAANELERKRAARELRENCPRCHGHNSYEDEFGVHPCQPHLEAQ